MKLKKINAVLALLSVPALFIHVGYISYAYLTYFFNPTLSRLTADPFILLVCLHAVCGMCTVFLLGDGTRSDLYPKQNKRTIIQRVSAALIFPLLIIHLNTYQLLEHSASKGKWFLFTGLLFVQVCSYAVFFIHAAVSFSRGLITLGLLTDRKKQKVLDRIVYVVFFAVTVFAVFVVLRTELMMLHPK